MDFNETEVVLQTERGVQAWAWNDFSTFLETPYFFHLYFNSRSFFLVPKDAFVNLEELQEARSLLKRRLLKPKEIRYSFEHSRMVEKSFICKLHW
jgi:hypothetical protein